MKKRFNVYLIDPCPITAAHLSACIMELGGKVYHSESYYLSNDGFPTNVLNPYRAVESDLAIITIAPHRTSKYLFLANQLHWIFELPVIWISNFLIETDQSHYMFNQGFPIIRKPFSEYQVKRTIRDTLSRM